MKTIERARTLPPLPEVDDATRREFLIGAAGLLWLPAGCGNGVEEGEPSGSGETRSVEHLLGTTEVPASPERVVALDGGNDLEALCALDVTPIAAGEARRAEGQNRWENYIESRCELDGVEFLTGRDQANLERVAALWPDLILYEPLYDELSRIAPTGGRG
jgi:iron complex transport system substrate-binding protein